MLRGGDYSFARPDPQDLVAAGWRFVVRYCSRVDGGKNLTPSEALALSRAGLRIATVWENVATDRDPLKGYQQGVADALDHHNQVAACGGPVDAVLWYAVDWNATKDQFKAVGDYFEGATAAAGSPALVGCYGHTWLLTYLFDRGVIGHGWIPQASSWSAGHDEPRAKLRQTGGATIAGSSVDLDEYAGSDFGWRLPVTFAPPDLQAVQSYAQSRTGQDLNSLGIVGDTSHQSTGGYHVGNDVLKAIDSCPGPACSLSDYSYADARAVSANGLGRDLAAPGVLAGDDDAASAFDMGGGFSRFLEFNAWMRDKLLTDDPRAVDIREMIYTVDGLTVHRIDRTGRQPDSGDSSHLFHTHFSFFRDSLGRRDRDDNFLGLLKEFFGDVPVPSTEEDDMALEPTLVEIQPTNKTTSVAWSQKAAGVYAYDNMFLAIGNDTWDVTNPGSPAPAYRLRVFEGNGSGWAPWHDYKDGIVTLKSGERLALPLRADTTILSIIRLPLDDGTSYDGMLTALVGYEKA